MSLNRFHITVITAWFVTLVSLLAARFALSAGAGIAETFGLLVLGCVPAVVLVVVFRGAPTTIGQILYTTDQASSEAKTRKPRDVR